MRWTCLLLLTLSVWSAEETLRSLPGDDFAAAQVAITVRLLHDGGPHATLAVDFIPQQEPGGPLLHLYSRDLPADGLGRPTRFQLADAATALAEGPLRTDPPLSTETVLDLPVYPPGPVTLIQDLLLPRGEGARVPVDLLLTYMSCSDTHCNRPVTDRRVNISLPSHPQGRSLTHPAINTTTLTPDFNPAAFEQRLVTRLESLFAEHAAHKARNGQAIAWRKAPDRATAEALIAEAHAEGRAALLDFTGPSCANCQDMKKSVFILPAIAEAWMSGLPISLDTDASSELARWQRERFGTEARPLYVRIDPDGEVQRWSQVFSPDNHDARQALAAFLRGGRGSDAGTGDSWWQFVLLAIGGGLFTLLMPCTYPMIPLTVNFFTKQAAAGRSLMPLALAYGGGLIGFFTGLGLLVTFVVGSSVARLAGNPWTNLVIALLFIALGLSLLGAFFLRLPTGLNNRLQGGARGGYLGALLMGLTFAITAFTCTAPFAGAVLAQGVGSGDVLKPTLGMLIYASAIAVPFIVLALIPALVSRLPGAGAWMDEVKHIGGLIEIAAALKFLAICDAAWGWGLIGRDFTLIAWSVLAFFAAAYLLGWWRLHDDRRIEGIGIGRLLWSIGFFMLALYFVQGLLGPAHLGVIESFFPADAAPARAF